VALRPLHAYETSVTVMDQPVSAAMVDLATYMTRCAHMVSARSGVALLYLRHVHGHLEAGLWNDMIDACEEYLGFARGTVRATVVVDNLASALEADEILFEMLHHSAGLSLDALAYAADHIALFGNKRGPVPEVMALERATCTMVRNLSLEIIGVCHRRRAHAMGTMPYADHTLSDAQRSEHIAHEAVDGHDGAIVGQAGQVQAAMIEYNKSMPLANQFNYARADGFTGADLAPTLAARISVEGLRWALRTCLASNALQPDKCETPIPARSCVQLALAQLWQWVQHPATGLAVNAGLMRFLARKEAVKLADAGYGNMGQATDQLLRAVLDAPCPDTYAA
jgi:malate synthase